MSDYRALAETLKSSLELSLPPIAVAICEQRPAGIDPFDGVVPAGCSFWEQAATRTFFTVAQDHALCSIGVHTHNFIDAPESQPSELEQALTAMSGLDYVRTSEVASIPVMRRRVDCVVYGPLEDFSQTPDVVLLFAHSQQGLILSEAATRVDNGVPHAMGRPACAIVPQVANLGTAAMSLGCCGARAYLDALDDSSALWAFPGAKLSQYCEEIQTLAGANETLTVFHQRRRQDVESGKRPSVQQSLERLS